MIGAADIDPQPGPTSPQRLRDLDNCVLAIPLAADAPFENGEPDHTRGNCWSLGGRVCRDGGSLGALAGRRVRWARRRFRHARSPQMGRFPLDGRGPAWRAAVAPEPLPRG